MRQVKQAIVVAMLVVVLVVMIQNHAPIQFRFLNWTYTISQLLVVLVVFVLGLLTGIVSAKWPRRKKDEYQTPPPSR